jgi:hypothetical protein
MKKVIICLLVINTVLAATGKDLLKTAYSDCVIGKDNKESTLTCFDGDEPLFIYNIKSNDEYTYIYNSLNNDKRYYLATTLDMPGAQMLFFSQKDEEEIVY